MTLPRETIDKIIKRSHEYAGDGTDKESVAGRMAYQRGATEWAVKAQGLVDALIFIKDKYPATRSSIIACDALAKYKEVTNG